jgi:hypothetical protein
MDIDYNPYTGIGMKREWINNFNHDVLDLYHNSINKIIDNDKFIINLYKYFTIHYNLTIIYEYSKIPNQILVRPSAYIKGEFLTGLNWQSNKLKALQQIMILLCNEYYYQIVNLNYKKQDLITTNNIMEL